MLVTDRIILALNARTLPKFKRLRVPDASASSSLQRPGSMTSCLLPRVTFRGANVELILGPIRAPTPSNASGSRSTAPHPLPQLVGVDTLRCGWPG
jgi:hypothetical protein